MSQYVVTDLDMLFEYFWTFKIFSYNISQITSLEQF